jgi:DNA-binding response OmpR family regulator
MRFSKMNFDAFLLDAGIKKATIHELIKDIKTCRGDIPSITLINEADEIQRIEAVRHGAQDYLVKNRIDTDQLAHSIIFSMKRNTLIRQIQDGRLREQHIRHILELSFKSYSLSKLLKQALDLVLSILPRADEIRAGIYIAKENINKMLLIVHRNFSEKLLH